MKIGHVLTALLLASVASVDVARAAPVAAKRAPELTRAPELLEFVAAPYPQGETGPATVVLRLLIDAEGHVQAAEIVQSAGPAFDEVARAAALRFVFSPAEVDGVPSPIRIEYAYAFEPPPPPPEAVLSGVIRDRAGRPIAGVEIRVQTEGDTDGPHTTTDAEGRFRFEGLVPGTVRLELSGERLPETRVEEALEPGEAIEVAYTVSLTPIEDPAPDEGDDIEIVVVAPPLRRETVSTKITAAEGSRVPGTSGDVVRVVESLPGVGRPAAGSGQLVVWGASPRDLRTFVDGVPITRLYHEGGLRTVIHPRLVESIELIPGGQGAAWGRGLGGLVSVRTKTPESDRLGGSVHADLLDASALLYGPLGRRKRFHLAGAVRASYLQPVSEPWLSEEAKALIPIPRYGDGQLRALWRPNDRDRLEIVALVAVDRFTRGIPAADPALSVSDARQTDFGRVYAEWVRDGGDGSVTTVTPFVGYTRRRDTNRFGAVVTGLEADAVLAGVRASHRRRVRSWLTVEGGFDAEVESTVLTRVGSLGVPPREGDIRVFGQPPPDQLAADRWSVVQAGLAPYTQLEFSVAGGKFVAIPGLRLDPYLRSVSRRNPPDANAPAVGAFDHDFAAEPRLALIGRPIDRLEIRGAVGLVRQMPAPEDLSAAFGNPRLPTARGLHTVLGAAVSMTDTLSIDVSGFYTNASDLAMRSPADAPLRARALEPVGQGRAYGVQALLRQRPWKGLTGWITYTFVRSERKGAEGDWRLFDLDQTHILTAVLSYVLPLGFEASARLRYASGFPRTPVVGAYFDAGRDRYQPLFGQHNSIRLPPFVQLDLRVTKSFEIRKSTLEIYLEVLNLWNRANAEEIIYDPAFRERAYIRGFPVLPVLGLRWDF